MPLSVWLPLLVRNHCAVSPSRILQAVRMTVFSAFNSLLHGADRLFYGRRVARTPVPDNPLFILGHWRTGTTLLHELLALDGRMASPTTYQCMAPHHFLLTEDVIPRLFRRLLPRRRPMDNVAVGFDRPQEDEFALCNLGARSPYLRWMFPNRPCPWDNYLGLEGLSPEEERRWGEALTGFVRRLAYRGRRRVVLKSPPHTARVGQLMKLFPRAQFIHLVRDPYIVFPSTLYTWRRLWTSLGLQVPRFEGLEEYVLETFERMYRCFERDRHLLGRDNLYEMRYEDLVRDPVGEVRAMYRGLGLGDFAPVEPRLREYVSGARDYRTNKFQLPQRLRDAIGQRWAGYIDRYGYARPEAVPEAEPAGMR
ncbi:MAG: sulfotransferase [Gemmataceae bacterium]